MVRKKKTLELSEQFRPEFWENLDQRTHVPMVIKKRVNQLNKEVCADSLAKKMLVQRAVFLALRIETLEIQSAATGEFDDGKYVMLLNCFKGLMRDIGLDRKDVAAALDLDDYVKANKRRANRKHRKVPEE